MRAAAWALSWPLLGACSYSLVGEVEHVRTEIHHLERRIPPESPLWISEGPDRFDPFIEDYTDRMPDFIYHHLLRKLHAMRPEEVEAQAGRDFDREACEKDPAAFRGKFWRVNGVVGDLHPEPVGDPKLPLRAVHAGIFFDPRMRPVYFHVVQKPDVLRLREDSVELKALFIKMVEYTTKSGRRVTAPFFIGKVLRRYL